MIDFHGFHYTLDEFPLTLALSLRHSKRQNKVSRRTTVNHKVPILLPPGGFNSCVPRTYKEVRRMQRLVLRRCFDIHRSHDRNPQCGANITQCSPPDHNEVCFQHLSFHPNITVFTLELSRLH